MRKTLPLALILAVALSGCAHLCGPDNSIERRLENVLDGLNDLEAGFETVRDLLLARESGDLQKWIDRLEEGSAAAKSARAYVAILQAILEDARLFCPDPADPGGRGPLTVTLYGETVTVNLP